MKLATPVCLAAIFSTALALQGCKLPLWDKLIQSQNVLYPNVSEGRIIAQVGPLSISEAEVRFALERLPTEGRASIKTEFEQDAFLEGLIRQKTLVHLAQRAGLERDLRYRLQMRKAQEAWLVAAYITQLSKSGTPLTTDKAQNPGQPSRDLSPDPEVLRQRQVLADTKIQLALASNPVEINIQALRSLFVPAAPKPSSSQP